MTRKPQRSTSSESYSDAEIERRRDEAIKRALRTPPIHLKDMKKKRKPKSSSASSKRGDG
jgi:hypothetical protein